MFKPKKKRKGDYAQVAHSVVQDVIKLSGKPIKSPNRLARKPPRK
jgi:hypothetical protein